MQVLFPEIKPYARHELSVTGAHTLYVDEAGNAEGIPVLFVHGGPGALVMRVRAASMTPNTIVLSHSINEAAAVRRPMVS